MNFLQREGTPTKEQVILLNEDGEKVEQLAVSDTETIPRASLAKIILQQLRRTEL